MNIRPGAAALIVAHAATAAWAQAPADSAVQCFARAYSAAHLAAHPGQRVVEMLLVLERYEEDGRARANMAVRAMVRDRFGEFFANTGFCEGAGAGAFDCGIECDGGQFVVEVAADGSALLRNERYRFVLYGGCGEEVADDRVIRIEADAEHRAFRLYPIPTDACPAVLWGAYNEFAQ